MTTPVHTGTEIQVNTYTTLSQRDPSIGTLADGGYVVTWDSNLQDGSQDGIYGQRFDATGNPVGSEFRVNTTTSGDQTNSEVTGLAGGGYVVTWFDRGAGNVYARRYDASGVAQGNEFLVNTETTSSQRSPAISETSDGGFVVTWMSFGQDGSNWGVFGQRYNASGVAQGGEFQINTFTTSTQSEPSVTGLKGAGGGFVVTWQSIDQDGSDFGVYAQRYNASGIAQAPEFRVNTHTSDIQNTSEVTALANGGFVVTWVSVSNSATPSQDGAGYGIFGQVYDAVGISVGSEFQVNTYTTSSQLNPKITELSDGGFVVVWMSLFQDGSGWGAYGQRYDSAGNAAGNEFQVATTTAGSQFDVTVTALANGSFVAAWTDGIRFTDTSEIQSHLFSYANAVFDADNNIVTLFGPGQTVDGLAGDDTITGADYEGGSDDISGGDGNDTLLGMDGDDILRGGAGLDNLQGGDGDDDLYIDDDDQVILGGAGYDRLFVEAGSAAVNVVLGSSDVEYAEGGAGGDTFDGSTASEALMIFGHGGMDVLAGAGFDDYLNGGDDNDTMFGNGGVDTMDGGAGNDTLIGGTGNDILDGGTGHDTINGGAGNDVLDAGAGFDTVNGDAGDDTIMGSVQADVIDGGADIDTVDYTNSANTQKINLVTNVNTGGNAHGDTLLNIENVIGSDTRGDDITGTSGTNILDGMGADDYLRGFHGDDVLNGGEGNDFHYGGTGADTMDGGNGVDWVMYNGLTTGVTVDLSTGIGSGGQADGDTYTNIERVRGSAVDDTITGTNGINKLLGDGGADTINGMGGKDVIRGGDGDDIINGGAGNDGMRGDAGSDTFIFELGSGHDFVIDFEDDVDTLNIDDNLFAGTLSAMQLVVDHMIKENDNRFHFDFGNGDVLHVLTTTSMELSDFYDDVTIV